MRIGKLNHRVTIQSCTVGQGSDGEVTRTYADVDEVWAEVRSVEGKEYFAAEQLKANATHVVRIRYRSDVTPDHRLIWSSRTLDINAVIDPTGKSRQLNIFCTEAL